MEIIMKCFKCGTSLPEGTQICPICGVSLTGVQQGVSNAAAVASEEMSKAASSVLTWGILGLAFACSFFASFLGIIFSVIGKNKANDFMAVYGTMTGKTNTGRNLAKAGLIVGIILTAIFVIYIIAIVFLLDQGASYYYY